MTTHDRRVLTISLDENCSLHPIALSGTALALVEYTEFGHNTCRFFACSRAAGILFEF